MRYLFLISTLLTLGLKAWGAGVFDISEQQGAFALLSERERQAVGLTFLLGLTQKRAAEILSVRPQTLNDARKRAVRKLREYFGAEDNGYRRCLA